MVKLLCFPIIFVVLTLLAVNFVKAEKNDKLGRGDNGGIPCAACTILLSISSQLAQIYNETTVESLERLCTYLPETYKGEKVLKIRQCLRLFRLLYSSTSQKFL